MDYKKIPELRRKDIENIGEVSHFVKFQEAYASLEFLEKAFEVLGNSDLKRLLVHNFPNNPTPEGVMVMIPP